LWLPEWRLCAMRYVPRTQKRTVAIRERPVLSFCRRSSGSARLSLRSNLEHDLADMGRCLHQLVSLHGLCNWKCGVNDRADFPRLKERPDLVQQGQRNGRLLVDRSRPQSRAAERQTLDQDRHAVELCLCPLLKGDLNQAPLQRKRAEVFLDIGSADHVENAIHPLSPGKSGDLFGPILLFVVDGKFGADFLDRFDLFGIADGRIHAGAEGLGKLDSRGADAAGTPVDEENFSGLQAAAVEDVRPDRKIVFREGRRFEQGQPRWNRQTMGGRSDTVLRIPTSG